MPHRLPTIESTRIAVIGLGYVGLPLAVEFGKQFDTVGFDIRRDRIHALRRGEDATRELTAEEIRASARLSITDAADAIVDCNVFIVTVPTPVDAAKRPDLRPLIEASEAVGRVLKPGDTVIYESTVYPGCTEEVCVPILERFSSLRFAGNLNGASGTSDERVGDATDRVFHCGYSPERVNPGDKAHRLINIRKVTSGSSTEVAEFVDALYRRIIVAGTHRAPSIKVAEAAKVIENTQRDLNIALVNDLAMLFNRLQIDTQDVLDAASSKWNFLPFRPGLVGGHCIGVDPYYLTHKAQQVGHHPQVILAGRRTNDGMGAYVAHQVVKLLLRKGINPVRARILVLGLAFKEDCPDLRNTRVIDLIDTLRGYNTDVFVHDPWIDAAEARHEFGLELVNEPGASSFDALILAVAHRQFAVDPERLNRWVVPGGVIYDVKCVLPRAMVDGRL